jgi:hypothetical protein
LPSGNARSTKAKSLRGRNEVVKNQRSTDGRPATARSPTPMVQKCAVPSASMQPNSSQA